MNKKVKNVFLFLLGLLSIPIFMNYFIFSMIQLKRNFYKSNSNYFSWKHGKIYYKVKGKGRPVLLLHGIGMGASSYEFRKNFDELSQSYRVYALDFLGFGKSDQPAMTYTGFLYVQLVIDFIRTVIGEKAHVIASSHGATYGILAANMCPDLIDKMILISPIGIQQDNHFPTKLDTVLKKIYLSPIIGTSFYNILASRTSIESFLKNQLYYNKVYATKYNTEHYYIASHQGGVNSKYAPASFLTQFMNLPVEAAFASLSNKICIVWGKECSINPVENLKAFTKIQPEAEVRIFDKARMVPHEEHAETFNMLAVEFLG